MFNQDAFNQFIVDHEILGFYDEPITLKSGKQSYYYVNWRKATADVALMEQIAQFVIAFAKTKELSPDVFVGVPEGATTLGIVTQLAWAKTNPNYEEGSHHFAMLRTKPKEHGHPRDRHLIGSLDGDVLLLEDVTTTGQSLIDCYKRLQEMDVKVVAAIGLTNRKDKDVAGQLNHLGCEYFEMSSAKDIIQSLIDTQVLNSHLEEKLLLELK